MVSSLTLSSATSNVTSTGLKKPGQARVASPQSTPRDPGTSPKDQSSTHPTSTQGKFFPTSFQELLWEARNPELCHLSYQQSRSRAQCLPPNQPSPRNVRVPSAAFATRTVAKDDWLPSKWADDRDPRVAAAIAQNPSCTHYAQPSTVIAGRGQSRKTLTEDSQETSGGSKQTLLSPMAAVAAEAAKERLEAAKKKQLQQAERNGLRSKRHKRDTPEDVKAKQANNLLEAIAGGVLFTARGEGTSTRVTPYLDNKLQARYRIWEQDEVKRQMEAANTRAVAEAQAADIQKDTSARVAETAGMETKAYGKRSLAEYLEHNKIQGDTQEAAKKQKTVDDSSVISQQEGGVASNESGTALGAAKSDLAPTLPPQQRDTLASLGSGCATPQGVVGRDLTSDSARAGDTPAPVVLPVQTNSPSAPLGSIGTRKRRAETEVNSDPAALQAKKQKQSDIFGPPVLEEHVALLDCSTPIAVNDEANSPAVTPCNSLPVSLHASAVPSCLPSTQGGAHSGNAEALANDVSARPLSSPSQPAGNGANESANSKNAVLLQSTSGLVDLTDSPPASPQLSPQSTITVAQSTPLKTNSKRKRESEITETPTKAGTALPPKKKKLKQASRGPAVKPE